MRRDYPVVLGTLYLFTLIGLADQADLATSATSGSIRGFNSTTGALT